LSAEIFRWLASLDARIARLETAETLAPGAPGGAHAFLSATHTDTLAAAVVRGDLIVGNSTPKWARLAKGSAYAVLTGDGTDTAWSTYLLSGTAGGKTIFAVTNAKTLTLTAANDYNFTIPATGTAAMLNQANSFTLINPLTTIAESWIGPSSTAGIYFKGGYVGYGTTAPLEKVDINGIVRIYDSTAVTGISTLKIKAGAGQGSNALLYIADRYNDWHDGLVYVDSTYALDVNTQNAQTTSRIRATTMNSNTVFGGSSGQLPIACKNRDTTANNWAMVGFLSAAGIACGGFGIQNVDPANSYADYVIGTRGADGYKERVRITYTGNVHAQATAASRDSVIDVMRLDRITSDVAHGSDGIGSALVLYAEDGAGNIEESGRICGVFTTAAHASQAGQVNIRAMGAAAGIGLSILHTGQVGASVPAPTAWMHLHAGTAAAGTAPLKLTTGIPLAAIEDGALEYHSSHLYFSIGAARYQLDQQGGVVHNLLSVTHGDTLMGPPVRGDLVVGNATPKWANLALSVPAAGLINYLGVAGGGTDPSWKTASSNPGTAAAVLASDVAGLLQIRGIGIDSATPVAKYIAMPDDGYVGQQAGAKINFVVGGPYIYATGGKVMVGAGATPARRLEVYEASAYQLRLTYDNTHYVDLGAGAAGEFIIYPTAGPVMIYNSVQVVGGTLKVFGTAGIGITPTAYLHVAAGTNAAGTAPFKLTSGVALDTIEDGALEYHGSHLYFSIGAVRYQLDQQSGVAPHAILSATHTDTLVGTVVRGDVIVGNSTPAWARLARGSANAFLRTDGTDVAWSTGFLAITAAKTLTVQNSLTLSGTDTKALTLTGSLTVGADTSITGGGTLALASFNLTIPATGTAAVGAGTLTVATANDVSTNAHTHTVTASNSPGAAAALLKTDASGYLAVVRLGLAVYPPTESLDVNGNAYIHGGNLFLGPVAAGAGNTGHLEFRELAANGTNVVGFKAPDSITADVIWTLPNADGSAGQAIVTSGAGVLSWAAPAPGAHDIVSLHTYTGGAALDVFGLSAPNTIARLTPSSNPGAAASILASNASGHLQLVRLGAGVVPGYPLHALATSTQLRLAYDGSYQADFAVGSAGLLTITPVDEVKAASNANDWKGLEAGNANAGTTAAGRVRVTSDRTVSQNQLVMGLFGSGNTQTYFGLTMADYAAVLNAGSLSNGLIIGTTNADPLILGTNNVVRMTITSGGDVTIGSAGTKVGFLGAAAVAQQTGDVCAGLNNLGLFTGATMPTHKSSHAGGGADKLKYARQALFYVSGDLAVGGNQSAEIVYRGPTATITRADGHVKTAPTDADLIFDINVNGTTIWSTQANRLTIAASATSGTQTTFNTTSVTDGQIITMDIDQVGSTIPGANATVLLELYCDVEAD
jgi:hypothetical protein